MAGIPKVLFRELVDWHVGCGCIMLKTRSGEVGRFDFYVDRNGVMRNTGTGEPRLPITVFDESGADGEPVEIEIVSQCKVETVDEDVEPVVPDAVADGLIDRILAENDDPSPMLKRLFGEQSRLIAQQHRLFTELQAEMSPLAEMVGT